ncbi:unnamed protein product [Brassica rapa subsp. trilocularis]|uniref:Uncharacterized protein n=2 Tax=Brassica TaxID=3705 RepID=M4F2J4_BRACM|nr:unnamed protein product [Brassica napus]CDY32054.1 BnaA07g03980D [Brassica napus]
MGLEHRTVTSRVASSITSTTFVTIGARKSNFLLRIISENWSLKLSLPHITPHLQPSHRRQGRLRMPRLRLQILITLRHEAEATSRGSDYASWMRLLSLTDLMEFSKKGEDD